MKNQITHKKYLNIKILEKYIKSFTAFIVILMQWCISSCLTTTTLSDEEKYNQYTEKYQSQFWNNLTYNNHDYSEDGCKDLYCSSEAEAIVMWAYGPGYECWNTILHANNGSTNRLDTNDEGIFSIGVPNPSTPYDTNKLIVINQTLRYKDYKFLDSALKISKAGKELKLYHGYEDNEVDLKHFIEENIGMEEDEDLDTISPEIFNKKYAQKLNDSLSGKSYNNWGYCATSFSEQLSLGFANKAQSLNTPMLEITCDADVNCAYISYTHKKFFNGFFLSWPHEQQVLVNRGAEIHIEKVTCIQQNNKNIIWIKCRMYKGKQPL